MDINEKKDDRIKLVAVVGATASGKTALAAELAVKLGGEVVSCDSMQIYRHMPVATAVPTNDERLGVPHHMIEFLEPDRRYSVAEYCRDAARCIADIDARSRIPILCGGTGLYYSSLVNGIEFVDIPASEELRRELEERYDRLGGDTMLSELSAIDPTAASRLEPADKKRIVRAFEMIRTSGLSPTEANERSRLNGPPYDLLPIGIDYRDRKKLYERINKRVDIMLKSGIIEEAKRFYSVYPSDGTAAQAIGYKELKPWLDGTTDFDTAVESLKRQTRRYAKRQLTWFRRDLRINWLFADDYMGREQLSAMAEKLAREFIYG